MLSLISCRSDIFRRREPRSTNNQIMPQLLDATCTQENHQKTKEIPRVPHHNFLYSCSPCLLSCEFKALMAGVGALIDKDPLPHSGAQSVSRWLLWSSTAGRSNVHRWENCVLHSALMLRCTKFLSLFFFSWISASTSPRISFGATDRAFLAWSSPDSGVGSF